MSKALAPWCLARTMTRSARGRQNPGSCARSSLSKSPSCRLQSLTRLSALSKWPCGSTNASSLAVRPLAEGISDAASGINSARRIDGTTRMRRRVVVGCVMKKNRDAPFGVVCSNSRVITPGGGVKSTVGAAPVSIRARSASNNACCSDMAFSRSLAACLSARRDPISGCQQGRAEQHGLGADSLGEFLERW